MHVTLAIDPARVRFPNSRTILWVPRRDDATAPRPTDARLCVTREVIARLERDVASPGHPGLGFLLGRIFHCPLLDADYGVVEVAEPWPAPADEMAHALPSAQELLDVAIESSTARGRALLGWFHVQGVVRPTMSRHHVAVHRHLLGEAWQCTLILAPGVEGPTGAFFAIDPGGVTPTLAPFRELVAPEDDGVSPKRSCVTWSDYVAAEPVRVLRAAERRLVAARDGATWPDAESPKPIHRR